MTPSSCVTGKTQSSGLRDINLIFLILLTLLSTVTCDVTSAPPPPPCANSHPALIADEKRLLKCILYDYDPAVRPARNASDVITVALETSVVKVLDLDEKQHILTTNGWIYHEWNDFQLQWNPDDYGGLRRVRIPVERLWTPDIVLFNNADDSYKYVVDKLAIVYYTGKVVWVPHARLRSYCNLDLSRFPFDKQHCTLVFGSWSYDARSVNVTLRNNTKVKYIIDNDEWEIWSVVPRRHQWSYHENELYAGIVSAIELKRTSKYYQYIFIMPTVLFAFLALFMPLLPPLSRERIIYGMALILGCTMLLMMLENHMPTELGTVPVVAAYLAYILVMVTVNLFFSILAINMCMRDPKYGKVPGWMRWIFISKLSKLVCIPAEPYTAVPADLAFEETTAERELLDMNNGGSEQRLSGADTTKSALDRTLDDIRRYLRVVAARTVVSPQLSHRQLVLQEWQQVTRVMDRLLFVSFLILTVVITIAMYAHY